MATNWRQEMLLKDFKTEAKIKRYIKKLQNEGCSVRYICKDLNIGCLNTLYRIYDWLGIEYKKQVK